VNNTIAEKIYNDLVYGDLLHTDFSFSQNFEDVRLLRAFAQQPEGFFVDVGSAHPVEDSCTFLFDRMGWSGICIDAMPQREDLYQSIRTNSKLITSVINDGTSAKFYYTRHANGDSTGLSTTSLEVAEKLKEDGFWVEEISIPGTTLKDLLKDQNVKKNFEILTMDLEGTAIQALQYGFFEEFRPKVICLESTTPRSPVKDYELIDYVKSNNYSEIVHDGLNSFFVPEEEEHNYLMLAEQLSPFIDGFFLQWRAFTRGLKAYAERT
jgi:hypothetical protein